MIVSSSSRTSSSPSVLMSGWEPRKPKSHWSCSSRSGWQAISVMAPSVIASTPPSMRYIAPKWLHPALAVIIPSAENPIRIWVPSTSAKSTPPTVTDAETKSRPARTGLPPRPGTMPHAAVSTTSSAAEHIREMVIPCK